MEAYLNEVRRRLEAIGLSRRPLENLLQLARDWILHKVSLGYPQRNAIVFHSEYELQNLLREASSRVRNQPDPTFRQADIQVTNSPSLTTVVGLLRRTRAFRTVREAALFQPVSTALTDIRPRLRRFTGSDSIRLRVSANYSRSQISNLHINLLSPVPAQPTAPRRGNSRELASVLNIPVERGIPPGARIEQNERGRLEVRPTPVERSLRDQERELLAEMGVETGRERAARIFEEAEQVGIEALTVIGTEVATEAAMTVITGPLFRLAGGMAVLLGRSGRRLYPKLFRALEARLRHTPNGFITSDVLEAIGRLAPQTRAKLLEILQAFSRNQRLSPRLAREAQRILRQLETMLPNIVSGGVRPVSASMRYRRPWSAAAVARRLTRINADAQQALGRYYTDPYYREVLARMNSPRLIQFINEFHQANRFTDVFASYAMRNTNQRVGATFVMEYVVATIRPANAHLISFEVSSTGRAVANRFMDMVYRGIKYEFKNWNRANAAGLRRQFRRDAALVLANRGANNLGGLKWVFNSQRSATRRQILDSFRHVVNTDFANHPARQALLNWIPRLVEFFPP